jgi:hypothetical protein
MTRNGIQKLFNTLQGMQPGDSLPLVRQGPLGTGLGVQVGDVFLKIEGDQIGDAPPTNSELDAMPSDKPVEYHEDGSRK